jgi:hypothetical protein
MSHFTAEDPRGMVRPVAPGDIVHADDVVHMDYERQHHRPAALSSE